MVVDGNEKMYRLICAAEKSKIVGVAGEPSKYEHLCTLDPIRGNQQGSGSKYCHEHHQGMCSV